MAVGGASVALAVVAYRATLHIGLFSDDAVLLTRAAGWHLGWVGDQLLRPLPMGIWALVLSAGGGGLTLHLLNVVAHGVNAFLVYRVGRGQHLGVTPALLATAVFVLSPLATEPVVWISGYFDVLMTLLCCLAVLAARGYSGRRALGSRLALWVIVQAAFLTKETAVVLPALILIDTGARGALRSSRTLIIDCGLLLTAAAAMAAVRLMRPGGAAIREPLSK